MMWTAKSFEELSCRYELHGYTDGTELLPSPRVSSRSGVQRSGHGTMEGVLALSSADPNFCDYYHSEVCKRESSNRPQSAVHSQKRAIVQTKAKLSRARLPFLLTDFGIICMLLSTVHWISLSDLAGKRLGFNVIEKFFWWTLVTPYNRTSSLPPFFWIPVDISECFIMEVSCLQ